MLSTKRWSPSRIDSWAHSNQRFCDTFPQRKPVPQQESLPKGPSDLVKIMKWKGIRFFGGDSIFPTLREFLLSCQNLKLMLFKFTSDLVLMLWCDWSFFSEQSDNNWYNLPIFEADSFHSKVQWYAVLKQGPIYFERFFWRLHHGLPVDPVQKL